ncbi:MAG: beta-galactosidase [Rhodobacteraceae bacterium]|nr:beta-galactosidase [Paracoccaceae bacterium]
MKRTLGTCYYPEHWPPSLWEEDARRMVAAGLSWVRIGEFAWSRLEPRPDTYAFDWLDRALDILGHAGLRVVLGTPTATPPRWMLDRYPDMLALDAQGQPRRFGSRRHYCFSHAGYRAECARIATQLAQRYGNTPALAAWQIDNEYGCHGTALSYSAAAQAAFRLWLQQRYETIAALNAAWGNAFWSMDYTSFAQIDLPNLTVTTPNPAHVLDFRRFSSDQVLTFNRLQQEALRAHSDAPIAHNYMGRSVDFDHFAMGRDLDIAAWDSYPLGFLEDRIAASHQHKRAYARQGDPDFQAFHHDLYRGVGDGRWWVMEQQPGPVNWAPYNPAPLAGMVRLWTWEAFAHGAEAVCYFRWRQARSGQEQMHAGLLRPDGGAARGLAEVQQVAAEVAKAPPEAPTPAQVGLIFDYESAWAWEISPHGRGLCYFDLLLEVYRAMRGLGLSVDIVGTTAPMDGYKVIALPGLMFLPEPLHEALLQSDAVVLMGPRTAVLDAHFRTPVPLPVAVRGMDITVAAAESLRPDMPLRLKSGGQLGLYREFLEGGAQVVDETEDGSPAIMRQAQIFYAGGWLDEQGWQHLLRLACAQAGIETLALPPGVRRRQAGSEWFWFNYDTKEHRVNGMRLPPISLTRC